MKVASTKLTNSEWEALQELYNSKRVTIAEYLRGLIREDDHGLKESETHDSKEKPTPFFQLVSRQQSSDDSNAHADEEDDGFPPSTRSSKLPSEVAAIRLE